MSHTSQQNIAFHPSGVNCKTPKISKSNSTQLKTLGFQYSLFDCPVRVTSFPYVTLSVHFALNPRRILGQNQNQPLYTANVPSRIPKTTLTSRNARTYKPLNAKFTETHNSKSQQKHVPSLEIQTCAGRARFGDPRSHRSHCESTGKTPNPPSQALPEMEFAVEKRQVRAQKDLEALNFWTEANGRWCRSCCRWWGEDIWLGRIISNWLLCFFVMVLRFCAETVCLGRRLHSRERGEQREGRERSRTRGALEASVGGQPLWYQHFWCLRRCLS